MLESPSIENKQKIDALKNEHLREGVPSIMTTICDLENLDNQSKEVFDEIRKNGDYLDYYEDPEKLEANNMLNAGEQTYVISEPNENNKWSDKYKNCTGVIVVGTDKETGKEISILTHQDPWKFLKTHKQDFEENLTAKIEELLQKTEIGTVDTIIFGGNFTRPDEYEDSIKRISEICKKAFGHEPVVVTGPNVSRKYPTSVYLETQKRRLYLIRPRQPDSITNQSYNPSDIEEEKKKWYK
ncbi:MAG: hypothetical protein WC791_03675 [Candidatus Paceibacterota bacterium]|jgi:hypothetical protein